MAKLTKVEPKDIDFLKELDDGSVVFTKYATIIVPDKYFEKKYRRIHWVVSQYFWTYYNKCL